MKCRFLALAVFCVLPIVRAGESVSAQFRKEVQPILTEYCCDCHADGANKGGIAFDELKSDDAILNHDLWLKVIKSMRAGLMPPGKKPQPSPEARTRLEDWIKHQAFGIDAKDPDPGRVTVRRLNRVEYQNTIHDLLGVDFDTETEFPPDDTGYGFDNIGQVLTVSPMLLEKYLAAAKKIVGEAGPDISKTLPAWTIAGSQFRASDSSAGRDVPESPTERRAYAGDLLSGFASRAFRRPVDRPTVDRLVSLAESIYSEPGQRFAAGVAHAMAAVLASPRFLFREESPETIQPGQSHPFIDEYALASRLSYFLWSSMPDAELFRLAGAGELRKNLAQQVKRMLAEPRSKALAENFSGQWLQAREIATIVIHDRAVFLREQKVDLEMERRRARLRELRRKPEEKLTAAEKAEMEQLHAEFLKRVPVLKPELTGELRQAMRRETEMYFSNIVQEDRNVIEFIDSDYTFLNERLARHYGLTNLNVTGEELRRATLPPDSPRGGVLTMGSVLAVTSNPTRTSPVKRGLFILDNILGMPPPPPPPNIPPLEDAAKGIKGPEPTLRETLEMHRSKPLCSSCHDRMDPLGLALENFNALGIWRDKERDQPLDPSGKLMTGETFANIRELKRILVNNHRREFYQCLSEKLLMYATGRGLEYYDVETVDRIVERLERANGRFSALLMGVIESAPFQKRRASGMLGDGKSARPAQERADLKK